MRQSSSQTSNPAPSRPVLDKENYHYVKVQTTNKGEWESPINDYLTGDEERGIPQYEEVSRDSRVTGSSRMALLRCPKTEHDRIRKTVETESRDSLKEVTNNPDGSSFEAIKGGVLTVD